MPEYQHITHPLKPFYAADSKVLILGSFPSKISRDKAFYYANPQNRFWKLLSLLYEEELSDTSDIAAKYHLLKKHKIALWDVIYSCDIIGSRDSSIKNVIPQDIAGLVQNTQVEKILCNGALAAKLYRRYIEPSLSTPMLCLPSTSPANAGYSLEDLLAKWSVALS